jgi:predicted component of type VI protein secretion system
MTDGRAVTARALVCRVLIVVRRLWSRITGKTSAQQAVLRDRLASMTTAAEPAHPLPQPMIPPPPRPNAAKTREPIDHPAKLIRHDGTVVATLPCDFSAGTLTIGRGLDASIRIRDDAVSRVHAYINWDAAARTHVIEDAGGPNGTTVDHVRIRAQAPLRNGARIRVGKTVLFYRV